MNHEEYFENKKQLILTNSKELINEFRNLLNDVEKRLDSKNGTEQGIGVNYCFVIDECFKNFDVELRKRFDELEKKGIVERRE